MKCLILILCVAPQDLFEQDPARDAAPQAVADPKRFDLRFEADFSPAREKTAEASFTMPLEGDFAWNGFDLDENYAKMLARNARDDLLEGLFDHAVDQVSGSPMTLLCQISPTTCDSLKHYQITTQAEMGMDLDLLRSVEQKNTDAQGNLVAAAVKSCLKERRARGDTLREALSGCRRSKGMVRNLLGQAVEALDLVAEVSASLKLDPETRRLVARLSGNLKVDGSVLRTEVRTGALAGEYEVLRDAYVKAWQEALAGDHSRLAALIPRGAPQIDRAEVQLIADSPPERRRAMVSAMASAAALVDLTRRVHDVERALEAAARSPDADPEIRRHLEEWRRCLRAELQRLAEDHEREQLYRRTLAEVRAAAAEERIERINRAALVEARRLRAARLEKSTRSWGADCDGCALHPSGEITER